MHSKDNTHLGKDAYHKLCQIEESIPLFSRDWWLDIVCGEDNWDVLLIDSEKSIQAAMPFYNPKGNVITMPFYTQTMGPWLRKLPPDAKPVTVLSQRQNILKIFARHFKAYGSFLQHFHHDITDWLPFYWEGFKQTTRYTYILDNIDNSRLLWEQMATNTRRNIQKAEKKYGLSVRRSVSAGELLRMQGDSFKRQHLKPKGTKTLRRLIEQSKRRGQGDVWGAYAPNGQLHAAVFIVWQSSSAYYIAGGSDPALRDSGAHSLVLWKAIQDVATHSRLFDFEGSMLAGVERFFREFGATQLPYFAISKGSLSLYDKAYIKTKRVLNDIFSNHQVWTK